MANVLVIANQTLGGRGLLEAVRGRVQKATDAGEPISFFLVVPQTRPTHGAIVYADAVRDDAQARVDLALSFLAEEGVEARGEVGDEDPFTATIDAVAEVSPDEIIVSTLPRTSSGWLRRDLVERIQGATGLPVEHVIVDIEAEGMPVPETLVVANRTVTGEELIERLKAKAAEDERHMFVVVVPQEGVEADAGKATATARARLAAVLKRLREEGLVCAGMIGDPDPYAATMNALESWHPSDIVISTHPATRSGWLRSDLVERVRRASPVPVEHIVVDLEAAGAKA